MKRCLHANIAELIAASLNSTQAWSISLGFPLGPYRGAAGLRSSGSWPQPPSSGTACCCCFSLASALQPRAQRSVEISTPAAHSPSSPSPVARALQLPVQCDALPDSPQLRRVLDEMGIREVEQKHMQQQAELMLSSHNV